MFHTEIGTNKQLTRSMKPIKIQLLGDTHLGFDLPLKPRINRRRRGHDFFNNFEKAIDSAIKNDVDCIIHGGDLFYCSKIPYKIAETAASIFRKAADKGIPVYIVPGNHERSRIPHPDCFYHEFIYIFEKPGTFLLETKSGKIAIAGFPYTQDIRRSFLKILYQTGWENYKSDIRILCAHQIFEGAVVGVQNYKFRYNKDIIRVNDIPGNLAAVLTGHIHRAQVLNKNLSGSPIKAPVIYPGSIDRTSFAERLEPKGYMTLEFEQDENMIPGLKRWIFHDLKARPMFRKEIMVQGLPSNILRSKLQTYINSIPENSIVDFKILDVVSKEAMNVLNAPALRQLAPSTMNITASFI